MGGIIHPRQHIQFKDVIGCTRTVDVPVVSVIVGAVVVGVVAEVGVVVCVVVGVVAVVAVVVIGTIVASSVQYTQYAPGLATDALLPMH